MCSRRAGPSVWQSNGSRRLRQKTAVRVTDDVRGTTAASDVLLADLVTMGAPVLLISEEDDGASI